MKVHLLFKNFTNSSVSTDIAREEIEEIGKLKRDTFERTVSNSRSEQIFPK